MCHLVIVIYISGSLLCNFVSDFWKSDGHVLFFNRASTKTKKRKMCQLKRNSLLDLGTYYVFVY
jgi:hypothetical protein